MAVDPVAEKDKIVVDLIKDFHSTLTATAALLATISSAIAPFVASKPGFPVVALFYSAIAYLIAVVAGIVAHGALTSAVHYGENAWESVWVRIPGMIQWFAFIAGTALVVYMLFLLT